MKSLLLACVALPLCGVQLEVGYDSLLRGAYLTATETQRMHGVDLEASSTVVWEKRSRAFETRLAALVDLHHLKAGPFFASGVALLDSEPLSWAVVYRRVGLRSVIPVYEGVSLCVDAGVTPVKWRCWTPGVRAGLSYGF